MKTNPTLFCQILFRFETIVNGIYKFCAVIDAGLLFCTYGYHNVAKIWPPKKGANVFMDKRREIQKIWGRLPYFLCSFILRWKWEINHEFFG
ncbi:MAG: hypothetical protein JW715_17255 [Sedimentisphaerales bacterium]|nr:hypothetical protein [Sedimentisphaerales bacterium]